MASYLKGNVKRKQTVLCVEDKLKVCDSVRRKISKTDIMLKYNIGKSTVNDICKSVERLKIFKMAKCELEISKSVKAIKAIKAIKVGMYYKLDSALYQWFRQQLEKGIPVTGPILLEKANEFYRLLYDENFMCCVFVFSVPLF